MPQLNLSTETEPYADQLIEYAKQISKHLTHVWITNLQNSENFNSITYKRLVAITFK